MGSLPGNADVERWPDVHMGMRVCYQAEMYDQEFPGGLAVGDLVLLLLWHRSDPWILAWESLHAMGVAKTKPKPKTLSLDEITRTGCRE